MDGLDDLVDSVEEEEDEERVEELKDKLGVDNLEELERLDDRLKNLMDMQLTLDKRMEELEEKLDLVLNFSVEAIRKSSSDKPHDMKIWGEDEDSGTSDSDERDEDESDDEGLTWQ